MTKMQIIAKTVLTVLGIYTILTLCRLYAPPYLGPERDLPILWHVAFFCGFTPLAALVIFFLIFNNDAIARRITGPGPIVDRQTQTAWLIRSLRIGLVLTGLINSGSLLRLFVPLPIGIYLVCGAPHFVRWHVKKTLEQCQLDSADAENLK